MGNPGHLESTVRHYRFWSNTTSHYSPATPELIHQAEFALEVKCKVLPLYEEVFDIEYPLPKLDTLVVSSTDKTPYIP